MLLGTFDVFGGRGAPEFHSLLIPHASIQMGMGWNRMGHSPVIVSSASLDFDHFFDDTFLTDSGFFHACVLAPILQIETVLPVSKVSEVHLFRYPCLTEGSQ